VLAAEDDVAVSLRAIARGERLRCEAGEIVARDEIPFAHKIALRPIATGAPVRKFGVPIGRATADIASGALVHVHNIASDYLNNVLEHFED
jgi:altronate hydrolase